MPLIPAQVHLDLRLRLNGTYNDTLKRTTFNTPCPFYGTRVVRLLTGTMGTLSALSGTITNISVANPTVVTSVAHGLVTGQTVTIAGSNSTPTINGSRVVTRINDDTFTVPVNVTVLGTTGTYTVTDHTGFMANGNFTAGGAVLGTLFDTEVVLSEPVPRDQNDRPELFAKALLRSVTLLHKTMTNFDVAVEDVNPALRAEMTKRWLQNLLATPESEYSRFHVPLGRISERCIVSVRESTYKPMAVQGLEYVVEIMEGLR